MSLLVATTARSARSVQTPCPTSSPRAAMAPRQLPNGQILEDYSSLGVDVRVPALDMRDAGGFGGPAKASERMPELIPVRPAPISALQLKKRASHHRR